MKQKRIPLLLFSLLMLPGQSICAQPETSGRPAETILAYFENNSGDLRLVNEDGTEEILGDDLSFDSPIPRGWTLLTFANDSAEILVQPTGTIIKVVENSNIKIEVLEDQEGQSRTAFTIAFGMYRVITGRTAGRESFRFNGQAAAIDVSEADFGMQRRYIGIQLVEEAFVFKGRLIYTIKQTRESIFIRASESADAYASVFEPRPMSTSKESDLRKILRFVKLSVEAAPEYALSPEAPEEEKQEEAAPEEVAEEKAEAEAVEPEAEEQVEAKEEQKVVLGAGLALGFGGLSPSSGTFAGLAAEPFLEYGELKLALHLPLIYSSDISNPDNWYKSRGNNEWSFGTDQTTPEEVASDIIADSVLKIKYFQWRAPGDSFYIKLGHLRDIAIGNGFVMRGYTNNADFPSLRRNGAHLLMDLSLVGWEIVASDVTSLEVIGGRFYIRPAAAVLPLAIGFSGIADFNPTGNQSPGFAEAIGNPILIYAGTDADFPIFRVDMASLAWFGDFVGLLPYYRSNGGSAYSGVTEGLSWISLFRFDPSPHIRNHGAGTGFWGEIGPVRWRLEYNFFTGAFLPAIMGSNYDRQKGAFAMSMAEYTNEPFNLAYYRENTALLAEVGIGFESIFLFEVGYRLPFYEEASEFLWGDRDYLHLKLVLGEDLIPGLKLKVALEYDRHYFIPMVTHGVKQDRTVLSVFDENAATRATVTWGISEAADLMLFITSTLLRDERGSVLYHADGRAKLVPAIGFEAQIRFP